MVDGTLAEANAGAGGKLIVRGRGGRGGRGSRYPPFVQSVAGGSAQIRGLGAGRGGSGGGVDTSACKLLNVG